ncbi:MAG TPA: oligosaccharide flippase family protein, partial [Candidatus Binatia bacterium]|nr:oligosaccharide flippase family protein [Candidatus Binatia bacterium]
MVDVRTKTKPAPAEEPLPASSNSGELDSHRSESNEKASKRHIRGSSILLAGRVVSLGLNFGVQVLTVRYLAKSDYGAFAYALSVVSMGASVSLFGLDKAVARFIPIYHENSNLRRMLGAVVMTAGTVLGIGLALIFLVAGLRGILADYVVKDPQSLSLLVVLIALAPMQAFDSWFQGMFAVFAKPQAIFFRRHVLGPGLKLLAVLVVIFSGAGVYTLALGYLAGGILGLLAYLTMLWQLLRENNLLQASLLRNLELPFREVFSFSTPLLTSDVVNILRSSMVIVFLEYFANTVEIAEFRAVLPVAGLNLVVMQSFKYLFTPLAARLF